MEMKYLSSFADIEYHFSNETVRRNRPKTQNAKRRVLNFFDKVVSLETEQREESKFNRKELVDTIESMKSEMQSWHNSLMDRNDILDKNLTDTIKEQVL